MTDSDSATQVFARVRRILPWEQNRLGIKWTENSVQNYGLSNVSKTYKFSKVLAPEQTNDEVFDSVMKPLIQRVLDGYNALCIAYGQTGAGKTYTLIGKPKLSVTGMLTKSLIELQNNKSVKEIKLRAVEAYGVKPTKILLFDLLDEKNATGNWSQKDGNPRLQIEGKTTTQVSLKTEQECFDIITKAQMASHFAPTGKNPESSRGHIVFVIDVKGVTDNAEEINSSLVFADLAGSEGESALTEEFAATVTPSVLLARKLEGGVINIGLSDLQMIFNNLKSKGKLSKSTGSGLTRMLKPYINANTYINVIFCLSPSFVNCSSSEATLKFAARACQLKTAPVKAERKINYQVLAAKLKEEINDKQGLIDRLENIIYECLSDGNKDLKDKLQDYDLLDHFGETQQPMITRQKSLATLELEEAQKEDDSWNIDTKSKAHRRIMSTVYDIPVKKEEDKIIRNDEEVVDQMMKESEKDENTRAYLGVIGVGRGFTHTIAKAWERLTGFTNQFSALGRLRGRTTEEDVTTKNNNGEKNRKIRFKEQTEGETSK